LVVLGKNTLRINSGSENWERWAPANYDGAWLIPRSRPSPFELPRRNWSLSVNRYERTYGDVSENWTPRVPPCKGHSRSSELMQIDQLPTWLYI